jgi:hypothetical protein
MKNNCIDCNKQLSRKNAKRCHSCEMKRRYNTGVINHKGKNHPNFGNHKLEGKNNPMFGIHRFGKNNPNYKNGSSCIKRHCLDCKKIISRGSKGRCKTCSSKIHSQRMIGINNPFYGKIPQYKTYYYKNILMRSSWEVKYAKYLDKNNIKWDYEPKFFELGYTTYTPDFYLPKTDEYIEIKGWWRDKSLLKFKLFKKLYKNIKITVLNKNDLMKLNILAFCGVIDEV